MYVPIYIYMCVYVYVYMCVCMRMCVCVCAYIVNGCRYHLLVYRFRVNLYAELYSPLCMFVSLWTRVDAQTGSRDKHR